MTTNPDSLVDAVLGGRTLSEGESAAVFEAIMGGALSDERIEQLLLKMADRGETIDEIVGAARVLRSHATPIACDAPNAIDTCGTGGDGINTFNVSTAAALVAAGAGAVVAKHGNRSNSRASGSAEVMAALGVNVEAPPPVVERCLREIGFGFLHAARLHPAMGRVAAIRKKIGRPTIFNLLGPLANPARVRRQVVGVPRSELLRKIATALQRLGAIHVFVVHGEDGLCDLTITGPTQIMELSDDQLRESTVRPQDVGLAPAPLDVLRVTSAHESADAIRAILGGEKGPRRDHTLLNAAAALVVAGVAEKFGDGVRRAGEAIDSGAAAKVLDRLVELTRDAR
ncbi:MAG TPA: anthranilate phosphoribosyltransferase [Phycisphaerae bacterium]|nr:anthranilate phosphoribosyltransferase [Phycisphaerae bacterium]